MLTGNPQNAVAAIWPNCAPLNSNSTPRSFKIPARIPKLRLVTNKLAQLAMNSALRFVAVALIYFSFCVQEVSKIHFILRYGINESLEYNAIGRILSPPPKANSTFSTTLGINYNTGAT